VFAYCTKLRSVTIPNGLTSIGNDTFFNCYSLTSIIIPNSVTSIGDSAFAGCSIRSVTIPKGVTYIGQFAFYDCYNLTSFYFKGNAPGLGYPWFYSGNNTTVYYLPGTTGWGLTFGELPTKLWNPQVQTKSATFGVRSNLFGFTITGTSGLVIVVEACTNLASPVWQSVRTVTLTFGSSYFSDSQWTNYPGRFYRLRSP
jgi:hypothetical protein